MMICINKALTDTILLSPLFYAIDIKGIIDLPASIRGFHNQGNGPQADRTGYTARHSCHHPWASS